MFWENVKNFFKKFITWFAGLRYSIFFHFVSLCGWYYLFSFPYVESQNFRSFPFPLFLLIVFFQLLFFLIIASVVFVIAKIFKLKIKPNKFIDNFIVIPVSYLGFLLIMLPFLYILITMILPSIIYKYFVQSIVTIVLLLVALWVFILFKTNKIKIDLTKFRKK